MKKDKKYLHEKILMLLGCSIITFPGVAQKVSKSQLPLNTEIAESDYLITNNTFSTKTKVYCAEGNLETNGEFLFENAQFLASKDISIQGEVSLVANNEDSVLKIIEFEKEFSKNVTSIEAKKEDFEKDNFSIYPNPNNGNFTVNVGGLKSGIIRVEDMTGKLINEQVIESENTNQFQLNEAAGMYLVRIITENQMIVKKIVIQ